MKKFLLLCALASLGFSEVIYQLNVPNMGCQNCADKINAALKTLPGYKNMSADFDTKDVNITTDSATTLQQVIKAIENSPDKKFKVSTK